MKKRTPRNKQLIKIIHYNKLNQTIEIINPKYILVSFFFLFR
jgi:hypothetical protein